MRLIRYVTLATVALLAAAPAMAAPADMATVQADQTMVEDVFKATQTRGYTAVAERMAALEAVVERAPKGLSPYQRDGDNAYVRTTTMESCLLSMTVASASAKTMPKPPRTTSCLANPYTHAAYLLGAYWDEQKRFDEGLIWLDRSVALDPDYGPSRVERGLALNQLRRFDDALANDQMGLSQNSALFTAHVKGALQRGEGFALTELGRLDEAEAAYRESLKTDPDHGAARNELTYIANLRTGAPKTGMQINSQVNPKPH